MRIFDFDIEDRLDVINKSYLSIMEIKDSLSDFRGKYRDFASQISISNDSLFKCCDVFERVLLIDCYTFSEQLVKNFFYSILQKDNHQNNFVNSFINRKIPIDKFSPNVKFINIENSIKSDLWKDFKFILHDKIDEVKVYNDLVQARHTYAHSGFYNFNFHNFESVIKVLNYICFELLMLFTKNHNYRLTFQNDYKTLKNATIEFIREADKPHSQIMNERIKSIRDIAKVFIKRYKTNIDNVALLESVLEEIITVSKIDLRTKKDISILKIRNLKVEISK